MNIKCPICKREYYAGPIDVINHPKDLTNHLFLKHDEEELAPILGDLLFKIHEKIEYWEKWSASKGNNATLHKDIPLEELKSLLENEK